MDEKSQSLQNRAQCTRLVPDLADCTPRLPECGQRVTAGTEAWPRIGPNSGKVPEQAS